MDHNYSKDGYIIPSSLEFYEELSQLYNDNFLLSVRRSQYHDDRYEIHATFSDKVDDSKSSLSISLDRLRPTICIGKEFTEEEVVNYLHHVRDEISPALIDLSHSGNPYVLVKNFRSGSWKVLERDQSNNDMIGRVNTCCDTGGRVWKCQAYTSKVDGCINWTNNGNLVSLRISTGIVSLNGISRGGQVSDAMDVATGEGNIVNGNPLIYFKDGTIYFYGIESDGWDTVGGYKIHHGVPTIYLDGTTKITKLDDGYKINEQGVLSTEPNTLSILDVTLKLLFRPYGYVRMDGRVLIVERGRKRLEINTMGAMSFHIDDKPVISSVYMKRKEILYLMRYSM